MCVRSYAWKTCLECVLLSLQLYPSLCELAHVLSVDGPVRQRLDSLAGELAKAADKELQVWTQNIFFVNTRNAGHFYLLLAPQEGSNDP